MLVSKENVSNLSYVHEYMDNLFNVKVIDTWTAHQLIQRFFDHS
jgi:hypothetical protein